MRLHHSSLEAIKAIHHTVVRQQCFRAIQSQNLALKSHEVASIYEQDKCRILYLS